MAGKSQEESLPPQDAFLPASAPELPAAVSPARTATPAVEPGASRTTSATLSPAVPIKAADSEIAQIQRIRDHQAKLVGWISLFFVTVGTSLGGIFSHWVDDRYLRKEGKSSDPPLDGDRTQESFTQERRLGIMTVVEVSSFPCVVLSFLLVALVLKTVWCSRKTRVATAGFTRLGNPTLRLVAMFVLNRN